MNYSAAPAVIIQTSKVPNSKVLRDWIVFIDQGEGVIVGRGRAKTAEFDIEWIA